MDLLILQDAPLDPTLIDRWGRDSGGNDRRSELLRAGVDLT
jgi:hypothetical protein